ncbi:exodeoxyribonuclease VII small subunit [Geitlerinema sp. PCC 7407]|uniref:exodeoxyribonuclease VII small subunit n=1 Tax=Geitlerinema sp. PCC 7407 TaxID=1173025 RepID=UPI00029FD85F|nr:exodeoxyribonuclease VII small subunit [Geitlerinema sp. PCC 7407]AFY64583.1 Exodeoxyribonuclease VII small subunit [Geitlerinema sp. PCC 7407]
MNAFPDQPSFLPASETPPPAALAPDWNYERTVAEIETIVAQIEAGELELADVFSQFSTAVEYLRQCEHFLEHKQQQMDLLLEVLSDDEEP